jgi:hypothetical protein
MAQMTTKEAIFRCCDALGIDVGALLLDRAARIIEPKVFKFEIVQEKPKPAPKKRPENPRVIDNDRDEITVTLDGKELRGWSYSNEAERRTKMLQAWEYVEGYCDGRGAA